MRPPFWHPPIACSPAEQAIITHIKRAKLFVFLRDHRHELFDDAFQEELATLYAPSLRGHPPIPPAQLALTTIVQAYTGVSDDEVIEATLMDRRWQLVLDCLDTEQAPFSKGTLVAFRKRLIEAQMDRRLIERTIELASQNQGFGSRALRAALDSSPLWGAGRVEDTYNLVGHALKKVLRALQQEDAQMAQSSLSVAQQIQAQDVEVDEKGKASLIKGVAKDRRISVEDSEMRHGRKSRSVRVDGYKRHVLHDLDTGLIRAVGITPANVPEASVTEAISEDLAQQAASLKELHIPRDAQRGCSEKSNGRESLLHGSHMCLRRGHGP